MQLVEGGLDFEVLQAALSPRAQESLKLQETLEGSRTCKPTQRPVAEDEAATGQSLTVDGQWIGRPRGLRWEMWQKLR